MDGVLLLLGGLPGVGKTTVARGVSRRTHAAHVRIDALEAGLVELGLVPAGELGTAGYGLAFDREVDDWAEPHAVVDTVAGDPVGAVRYVVGSASAG